MNFLSKLQAKPYETRVRILWVSVLVAGVLLVALFVFSVKNTVSNIDGKKLIQLEDKTSANPETQSTFAAVERVERTSNDLKVYFNFNNPKEDILNMPKLIDITLKVDGNELKALRITDRQGGMFVQKVLSHTQNFGILVFPAPTAEKGTLTFDQMFLEKTPGDIFKQTIELNLTELGKSTNVRH